MQIDKPWAPAKRRVIFDTADAPDEACVYGDDMRLEARRHAAGQRFLKLEGPEGEIDLPEYIWRNVIEAMALHRPGAAK